MRSSGPCDFIPGERGENDNHTRWDEKAGLRGMRFAPNVRRARGAIEKETGYEKD